jgi:hypothetical protein
MYFATPIEQCPHCGSTEGYYTKGQVRGSIITRYNYDGSDADNGDMYEHLFHTGGKVAYCLSCNKKLFWIEQK